MPPSKFEANPKLCLRVKHASSFSVFMLIQLLPHVHDNLFFANLLFFLNMVTNALDTNLISAQVSSFLK